MIDVIITSYNEPKSTIRAVKVFLKSKRKDLRVTVVDPFPEVEGILRREIKDERFVFYPDLGEGKSYALNLLMQEYASLNTNDLFILTDGDVYVSDNAVKEIERAFGDAKIGCVTGKPAAVDSIDAKYGYWAHVAFRGIDRARREFSKRREFFECSGYLFAIRKGIILDFPLETCEDSIIPYLFWKKGYKIKYASGAEVFVKNPSTWKDWLAQKIRNVKGHEHLNRIAPDMLRTKSFWNEVKWGALFVLRQPRTFRQVWWTLELYVARLYLYFKAFKDLKSKKNYEDGWRGQAETKTTRME